MKRLDKGALYTISDLEKRLGTQRFPDFVEACEQGFLAKVQAIGEEVLARKKLDFLFLSGPTSSGKTTFSKRFSEYLSARGKQTHVISLDDYYQLEDLAYDAEGRPDYERIETMDLALLQEHLEALARGDVVSLPRFDFKTVSRSFPAERQLKLEAEDVVLIEGLHALAENLRQNLDPARFYGMFIMPNASLLSDRRTLSRDDLRTLRRISRDVTKRGNPALSTVDYWPMIRKNEEDFVPRYLPRADAYINSALAYEFCVIAPQAKRELEGSIADYMAGRLAPARFVKEGLFYANLNRAIQEAKRLAYACELIPQVDASLVPAGSILREFI